MIFIPVLKSMPTEELFIYAQAVYILNGQAVILQRFDDSWPNETGEPVPVWEAIYTNNTISAGDFRFEIPKVQKLYKKISDLIGSNNFNEAETKINQLEVLIGNDKDITYCRSLIDFLK